MKRVLVTGGSGFIGTHLIEHLLASGHEVINIDLLPPTHSSQLPYWRQVSILDRDTLFNTVALVQPDSVVHLAAHASMSARSIDEFSANTVGVTNLIDAIRGCPKVSRLIVTSTQHVRAPGAGYPLNDTDYVPYQFYGESKVITESLTRAADLDCAWTIIRPTAVWGPGHTLLANGLWFQMRSGRYIHPAGDSVVRSYGYVKNLAWQITGLLLADRKDIDRKTFYTADGNTRQLDWVNMISRELTGKPVRTVPLWVLRTLSKVGDGLRACGVSFPLYDSRLKNMITPNPVPVEPILRLLGTPPYTAAQGAKETAEWLRSYYVGVSG